MKIIQLSKLTGNNLILQMVLAATMNLQLI